MRKNQVQKFTLKFFIFLGLLFLVFTCQKEDEIEIKETKESFLKGLTHLSFSGLKKNSEIYRKVDRYVRSKTNKTSSDSINFTIDTTLVQVIETENYLSYTFIANKFEQSETELNNYVLTIYNDNTSKQLLLTYPKTESSLGFSYDIENAIVEEIDGELQVNLKTTNCDGYVVTSWEVTCVDHNCTAGGNHSPGQNCYGEPYEQPYTICTGGWVDNCIEDNSIDAPDGESSSGGTTGSNEEDEIAVVPLDNEVVTWKKIVNCLNQNNTTLTQPQIDWLQNPLHFTQATTINNYLQDNNCSEEAQEFTVEAMQAFMGGGEVDFENKVFKDTSFKDTEIECIHDKLLADNQTNFYKIMIEAFSNNSFENLRFEIGSTSNGDWGISAGNVNNTTVFGGFDFYNITIDNDIENSSNISQMVTLCHELIHVYMFNSLDNLGVIIYDTDGAPLFDTAQCVNYQPNININNLSMKDRWVALICAYNTNNPNSQDWTHHLFNTANFVVDSYKSQLESFILNNHDWDNEPLFLKTELQTHFGNQWKEKASEFISWRGLEKTDAFIVWAQNNNINSTLNSNGEIQDVFYNGIISSLKDYGKSDCL